MSEESIAVQDTTQTVDTDSVSTNIAEKEEVVDEAKDTANVFYGDKEDSKEPTNEKTDEETIEKVEESKEEPKEESKEEKVEADSSKDDEKEFSSKDLVLDDKSKLSDADMERIDSLIKDQGLSKEAAQKVLDNVSDVKDSYFKDLQDEHTSRVEEWGTQVRSDKEIGGDNLSKSVELAKRVLDKFGTDDFKKYLDDSGYGNHPEVVRVFARIGKVMADDSFVKGGVHSGGSRPMEDIFYGTNKN